MDRNARDGRWIAPVIFGIKNAAERREFLTALRRLRVSVFERRIPTILDFSETKKMYAEATLLFLAELQHVIRCIDGAPLITSEVPGRQKIAQILKQIGVFDLLGTVCNVVPIDSDVVNWRSAHGLGVKGDQYETILATYDGEITPALSEQLYTGITEAMANVVNHASVAPREDGLPAEPKGSWWMFSQELDGDLYVAFCDLGAGIPTTLPLRKPSLWQQIRRLRRVSDADAIEYAIQESISRTGETHRGRVLGQIIRSVEEVRGALVTIVSNRGIVSRFAGKTTRDSYNDSIMGTLIYWRIPLAGEDARQ